MIAFKSRLKETIYDRLKGVYPVTREDLDMAPTPDPKMGDLALTFPFALAKTLKKAPRVIAQEAAPLLGSIDGVVKAEVAGGGRGRDQGRRRREVKRNGRNFARVLPNVNPSA